VSEVSAIDRCAVIVEGDITPDRAPQTGAVNGDDIFSAIVGRTDIDRQQAIVVILLNLLGDVNVEGIGTFDIVTSGVNDFCCNMLFVKLCYALLLGRDDKRCGEDLALFIVGHILILLGFQCLVNYRKENAYQSKSSTAEYIMV